MRNEREGALINAIELHAADQIRAAFDAGLDANAPIDGRSPVEWLIEMYTRSPRFPACLRAMLEAGAVLDDAPLRHVLLDDADDLAAALAGDRAVIAQRRTLTSAFTPLLDATLLHIAAEFGHARAARVLIDKGSDVDAHAGLDADQLGGQTPIFHTVNANANHALPILRMLLDAGAGADVRIAGLTWGRGFEWETTLFDLTPISYAQFGLLPQFHRDERQIAENVKLMLASSHRPVPPLTNVPNRYLMPKKR